MRSLTETLAKKLDTQPSQTYYRGYTIVAKRLNGVTWYEASNGRRTITKSDYKSVLDSINKQC